MTLLDRFLKKEPLYSLRVLIRYIKLNFISSSDYSYRIYPDIFYDTKSGIFYEKKIAKLINLVNLISKDEIKLIIEILPNLQIQEKVKSCFIELRKINPLILNELQTRKGKERYFLERETDYKLKEYTNLLNQIVELEQVIFSEIDFEKYLIDKKYKIGKFLGKGGNSKAYEVIDYPNLVIIIANSYDVDRFRYEKQKEKISAKIDSNIGFAKILKVGIYKKQIASIVEKAQGKPLHVNKYRDYNVWLSDIAILANAPQEHYSKLIADIKKLVEYGISIDPSKTDNFFYNSNIGFTIIDPNVRGENAKFHSMIGPLCCYYRFGEDLDELGAKYILEVCNKLLIAGDDEKEVLKMKNFIIEKKFIFRDEKVF